MSNRITIVRGTTLQLSIALVDKNGVALPLVSLVNATAELLVRAQPADTSNVIRFTTTGTPESLAFEVGAAALDVNFAPGDTATLDVKLYFYQVQVTLADGSILPVVPWDIFDVTLGGSAEETPPAFDNTVKVNHDTPLPGDMLYVTPGGSPIENAQIRVYRKSDYDAGKLDAPVGVTMTDAGGAWRQSVLVVTGYTYTAYFFKPYEWGPDVREFFA